MNRGFAIGGKSAAIATVAAYAIGAATAWDFNPENWTIHGRLLLVCAAVGMGFFVAIIMSEYYRTR